MAENVNMLLEAMKYTDLASFLRSQPNRQAIAAYIMDEANEVSFFKNFPNLIDSQHKLDKGVGDIIPIKFQNHTAGTGLPGPAKTSRQLAGKEAQIAFAYRKTNMTVGIHRYAVAMETVSDEFFLPDVAVKSVFESITKWWTIQDDFDSFCTLFRDYPSYYAEMYSLSGAEETDRVEALFGRGTYNDVGVDPTVMYAGTSNTDLEDLTDTDTLSDTFVKLLSEYAGQEVGMEPLTMEDGKPFYGLICDQVDIDNFYTNASAQFKTDITASFTGQKWESPIFSNILGEYAGVRFTKWGVLHPKDLNHILANSKSIWKGLKSTPLNPSGMILAMAQGNDVVNGLTLWGGGDYAATAAERGVGSDETKYFLFLSSGSANFPYFNGSVTTGPGASSINKFTITSTQAAYTFADNLSTDSIVGRFQVGSGAAAGDKWALDYIGPVYAGTIKIGVNDGDATFVEDAYRFQIVGIREWTGTAWDTMLDDQGDFDNAWKDIQTAVGLDLTNFVIYNTSTYRTQAYRKARLVTMFESIRSILYGPGLMYNVTAKGAEYAEETRDYGAFHGKGMTAVQGKKLVTDAQGFLNQYLIAVWKRPPVA